MSNFPLYDTLSIDLPNIDITEKQKEDLLKLIKTIDTDGIERIYVLIRMYQLENSDDKSTFKIPYGGKYVKNDIKFDLNDLPNELKQLLYKFVNIHCKTMEEEKRIKMKRDI